MNLIEKLEGMRKFAVEHYNPMAASGAITVIDELISWHNKQSHIQVVMQAEVSDEHICKYCGVLTSQPDEDCYKNPNRAEGAAVGQRSGGTNAEARDCETCKHLESENPYPCGKCDENYCMWEAPSEGYL